MDKDETEIQRKRLGWIKTRLRYKEKTWVDG